MSTDDILSRAQPAVDARIPYGSDANQFGELRVPKEQGPAVSHQPSAGQKQGQEQGQRQTSAVSRQPSVGQKQGQEQGQEQPSAVSHQPSAGQKQGQEQGQEPNQPTANLRQPTARLHPVVMNIHGGFWRAKYDLLHASHLCAALTRAGAATWNLEYRRVGNAGGAWPGTFEDITNGYRFLRQIAGQYSLDMSRVVVMGHSAGGHLAVALAGHQAPKQASRQASKHESRQSPSQAPKQRPEGRSAENELKQRLLAAMQSSQISSGSATPSGKAADAEPHIRGVVSLAGVLDLKRAWELHLSNDAVVEFLGGTPAQMPDHYREADPMQLKVTAEQVLIHGVDDDVVPIEISRKYMAAKQAKGERVTLTELPKTGHYEVIDPESAVWATVERAVMGLLKRNL